MRKGIFVLMMLLGALIIFASELSHREAVRKVVALAEAGDAKSIFELAKLHDIGFDSIPVDTLRSSALYLLAAEKGYAPAMNFIGFRYYKGEGVTHNTDSALFWIRRAALSGDITAATNLGYLLTEGDSIPHNPEEALDWLAVAADAGVTPAQIQLVTLAESLATPKALALLGEAYAKGEGVAYDHHKSVEYFYEAAKAGNPSAQFVIAELLDIFPDALPEESAQYWYEKAAEYGITDSESAHRALLEVTSGIAVPSSGP